MTAATTPEERWRLGYRPALDGIRAIAVLVVMAYHFGVPGFAGGGHTGVAMFFVLSGFLITSLLLQEHDHTGSVNVPAFYMRRARRLLPALCALVAVVIILATLRGELDRVVPQTLAVLLYVSNWVGYVDGGSLEHLSHTWTLGVEEQFYLVWPLVLLCAAWARRTGAALVIAVAAIAVTLTLHVGGLKLAELERSISALMVGCVLAFAAASGRLRVPGWVASVVVAMLAISVVVEGWGPFWPWALFAVAVGTGALIGSVVGDYPPNAIAALLSAKPLVRIGRISYGLYLWHYAVNWEISPVLYAAGWHWLPMALVLSAVTFALALLSWRYVESPALRWRRSPGRSRAAAASSASA